MGTRQINVNAGLTYHAVASPALQGIELHRHSARGCNRTATAAAAAAREHANARHGRGKLCTGPVELHALQSGVLKVQCSRLRTVYCEKLNIACVFTVCLDVCNHFHAVATVTVYLNSAFHRRLTPGFPFYRAGRVYTKDQQNK